jgi:hypothetical protein
MFPAPDEGEDHAEHEGRDQGVDLAQGELPEEVLGEDQGREDPEQSRLLSSRPGESEREMEDEDRGAEDDEKPGRFGRARGEERNRNIEEGGERRVLELVVAVLPAVESLAGPQPLSGLVVHLEIHHAPAAPQEKKAGAERDRGGEQGKGQAALSHGPFQPSRERGVCQSGPRRHLPPG